MGRGVAWELGPRRRWTRVGPGSPHLVQQYGCMGRRGGHCPSSRSDLAGEAVGSDSIRPVASLPAAQAVLAVFDEQRKHACHLSQC